MATQANKVHITGSRPLSILHVINPHRDRYAENVPAIADSDIDREHQAQAIFYPALAGLMSAAKLAMDLSDLRKGHFQDLLNAIADMSPDELAWDEAIAEARHGR
jgi:hypothetical protein